MKKIISILLIIVGCFGFQPFSQASIPQSKQDSTSTLTPQPIEIIDINYEIGRVEKVFAKIENNLQLDTRFIIIDSTFKNYKKFLEKEAHEFKSYNPYQLSKYFLESTFRSWEGFYLKLSQWRTEINNRIISVQNELSNLDQIKSVWKLTLESEQYKDEPKESKDRISTIISRANQIKIQLKKQKRQYVILEDEITDMTSFCNAITEEVSGLQQHLRDSLFVATKPPIWKVKVTRSDYLPITNRLNKARHENAKTLRNYIATENLNTFWIVAVMTIALFILLRYRYIRLKFDETKPANKRIAWILIKLPIITIVSLLLLFFHLFYPYHPLLIGYIISLVLIINMRFILSGFIDQTVKKFITRIILLLIINDLEIIFWYFGNVARYYIMFEAILGVLLMVNYLKPNYWKNYKSSKLENKAFWILALSAFGFYFLSFCANFLGYLNLAVLLAKAGVHIAGATIIIYGFYQIIVILIHAFIKIGQTGKNSILTNYWNIIEKKTIQIIQIIFAFYWMLSLAVSFEVSRIILVSISEFFTKQRSIGTLNITIGSIFTFIFILLATFLISRLLKFLIEDVTLKRANLPRGIPAAISVTIRYFLIVLGFTFALSAAGIDLGKFSLLAGALGVGIGFGLQNIVNNFISGLILVYERPLQVGDTIEVENLLGKVNRIGIRSSNVRTYDGAEVLVPNGNLISNQLINWTLSDNKRRIEIKVGVSYGSDPNIVLKLLEEVAMENEDTLKVPEPRALFEDFGNSSLNFRLLFWVPYDIGIGTKSDVSICIFNKFKENNIEIPFPQLDLHVKKGGNELEK